MLAAVHVIKKWCFFLSLTLLSPFTPLGPLEKLPSPYFIIPRLVITFITVKIYPVEGRDCISSHHRGVFLFVELSPVMRFYQRVFAWRTKNGPQTGSFSRVPPS